MIISATPLRISFVGGGSDLPIFYRRFGGAVLSVTVNKYVYITVKKKFDSKIRLSYSHTEEVESCDQLKHPLVKEALELLAEKNGLEIVSISDIPSRGTGLGSSSAFTAGLLLALHAYKNQHIPREKLARLACHIELDRCGEPIGKQDQYASVYGGFNYIKFRQDDAVEVIPIICAPETRDVLQRSLLLFYTNMSRSASSILQKQRDVVQHDQKKQAVLQRMVRLSEILYTELQSNNIGSFGEILDENWVLKRSIEESISNDQIDQWYRKAKQAGAIGGKLLGAGGGGFLLFFVPPDKQESVKHALSDLRVVDFSFEFQGSRIVFYQGG